MGSLGIKVQGITGLQTINIIGMSVNNLTFQHMNELDAWVLEQWEDIRLFSESHNIGLNSGLLATRMTQKFVMVPRPGSLSLDV